MSQNPCLLLTWESFSSVRLAVVLDDFINFPANGHRALSDTLDKLFLTWKKSVDVFYKSVLSATSYHINESPLGWILFGSSNSLKRAATSSPSPQITLLFRLGDLFSAWVWTVLTVSHWRQSGFRQWCCQVLLCWKSFRANVLFSSDVETVRNNS